MPLPKRKMLTAVPRHWTVLRAMAILGVAIEPYRPHRSDQPGRRRSHRSTHGERVPGGPEYIYETARLAYRQAARSRHPDHGGTVAAMQALNEAMDFIERRYGPARGWTR